MSITVMSQALEALEDAYAPDNHPAITSLRQAIAEAEQQKPVVLGEYDAGSLNDYGGGNVGWWWDYIRYELGRAHDHYQEQVADLYTHPQPRKPLTEEQIVSIVREASRGGAIRRDGSTSLRIARAIEAAHGIKE